MTGENFVAFGQLILGRLKSFGIVSEKLYRNNSMYCFITLKKNKAAFYGIFIDRNTSTGFLQVALNLCGIAF